MISYAQKIFDSDLCSHSIDNLVIEYYVDSFSADRVMDSLAGIFSSCVPDWDREKCTRDDLPACSKYQYFKHTIWGGGFHISYGHYKGFDKVDRTWDVLPVIRFKFNPNKWMRGSLFDALHAWIRERCDNGVLLKYDYAIDVPCRLCDLAVDSRKEPGLYKGTRYYGQRNQHGRLKIYDKKTESAADVPDDMTRVEWTFCSGREIAFDTIVWLTDGPAPLPAVSDLAPQTYAVARVLLDLKAAGGSVESALQYFDRRTRKKLEPYTVGTGARLMENGADQLHELLRQYCDLFSLSYTAPGVNGITIGSDVRASGDELDDVVDDVLVQEEIVLPAPRSSLPF